MDITRANEVTKEVEETVSDMFTYHPWNTDQMEHGSYVKSALEIAMLTILRHVPPCPDRSAAIRKLRESRMDCNSAITHAGKY